MASYPGSIPNFTTKQNVTDTVDASHPNSVQDEVRAMALTLGTNPHASAARGVTYADVDTRLERIELDYSLNTHIHGHAALSGLTNDDHTLYLNTARHDVAGRHQIGTGLGIPAAPTTAAVGDAAGAGTGLNPAREDHRHGMPAFAIPVALTVGVATAQGTAATLARSDHVHGFPAAAAPTTAAMGDVVATGVAATISLSDHRHGMPAFAAPTALTVGVANAAGVAATLARSDHVHGMPGTAAPTTAAAGDVAAAGVAATISLSDHRHGMPAFAAVGTISTMQVYGIAPSAGVSALLARADHNHGTPDPTLQGPSGVMVMYGGTVAPSGWLFCDGSAVSRTTYATLFGIIQSRFGAGDGSTTFNLPDWRGRVPLGTATIATVPVVGTTGGHSHGYTTGAGSAHNHAGSSAAGSAHSHSLTIPTGTGAGSGHNHGGTTGNDNNDHTHSFAGGIYTGPTTANHTHTYPDFANYGQAVSSVGRATDGQSSDHQHTMSGFTTALENQYHGHNFTTSTEAGHTHAIGAGSIGNESTHTHTITVTAEGAHTHGGSTDTQTPVTYLSVAFIIKT